MFLKIFKVINPLFEEKREVFYLLNIHAKNIKKFYADRLIFEISDLKIYSGEKIGIVGINGAGKTTLLDMLSGRIVPDEGSVKVYTNISYIRQFGFQHKPINSRVSKEIGVVSEIHEALSGGEKTKLKIARELSEDSSILFADEPTTNLDMSSIKIIEEKLMNYKGTLLLISHDRELLDKVCTSIIEIENGKLNFYNGNYYEYKRQKEMERDRQFFEYEQYVSEKKRLKDSLIEKNSHAKSIRKTPKRMGNSEARIHKRESNEIQEKLHKSAKSIETRIEKLEKKEKPKDIDSMKIEFNSVGVPVSKVLVRGTDISLGFGDRILFDNSSFEIANRARTALIGNNGSGKTTLIKMILAGSNKINIARGTNIGYFSQELDILEPDKTILENIMRDSIQTESVARTILARLLFKRDDVFKNCSILSGGEKVKASFAKLLVSNTNFLILDEPTNYLDLTSIEALSSVLSEYNGALLFISHDRRFIDSIAEKILLIEDSKIKAFDGNLSEYNQFLLDTKNSIKSTDEQELIKIEHRISFLIGKLSTITADHPEYDIIDKEFKDLIKQKIFLKNSRMNQ